MFYNKSINLALISLKTAIALDFINKLNSYKLYNFTPVEIDFEYILPRINEMSGVWVSDLRRVNVKTIGFFGHHVNKSKEFEEISKEGNVSAVIIAYTNFKTREEHKIGISKKGTVTLYDTFNQLEDELEIIMALYNDIIKKPAT